MSDTTLDLSDYVTVLADDFTRDTALNRTVWQGFDGSAAGLGFSPSGVTLSSDAADSFGAVAFHQGEVDGNAVLGGSGSYLEHGQTYGGTYGLYQITATMAQQKPGPCLLLWPTNGEWPGSEIDLLEINQQGRAYATNHWKDPATGDDAGRSYFLNINVTQPHTYAVDWEPGSITYYLDGQEIFTDIDHVPTGPMSFGAQIGATSAASGGNSVTVSAMSISKQVATPSVQGAGTDAVVSPLVTNVVTTIKADTAAPSGVVDSATVPVVAAATQTAATTSAVAVSNTPSESLFSGAEDQYVVTGLSDGSLYVADTVAGRDGTTTLPAGRVAAFSDGTVLADPTGAMGDVARLYRAAFGREPDPAGMAYWAGLDTQGAGLDGVAAGFTATPEFQADFGDGTDAVLLISRLYQNVLGRAADPAGQAYWVGAVAAGASTAQVLASFSQSPENEANTASMSVDGGDAEMGLLYQAILARPASEGEAQYWSADLQAGASVSSLAEQLAASPEFQAGFGQLGPAATVAQLYQNALGRAPDAAGLSYWTAALAQGNTPAALAVGLVGTDEARIHAAASDGSAYVFLKNPG